MTDRVGQTIGSYRLLRLLGSGGFAEVYLGQHLRITSQQAAVKILSARLQEEHIQSFTQEAETIAALHHPHIIRVLDFDVTDDGVPFLVMDYAAQGSLRQRHKRGEQVPLSTVVAYMQPIAEGLHYAHEHRIIHRDIKPDNILIDAQDKIVLSDFGIATIAHSTHSQSEQGTGGTIPYMAPEQIQDFARPASDQYALGIMVYEWLAGERPFNGTFTEIAAKQALAAPPPLSDTLPAISPIVERVVLTALEKNPHNRFATVRDFARALQLASRLPATISIPPQYNPFNLPKSISSYNISIATNDASQSDSTSEAEEVQEVLASEVMPPTPPSSPITADTTSSVPTAQEEQIPLDYPDSFQQVLRHTWAIALAVLLVLFLLGGGYLLFALSHQVQTSQSTHATTSNTTMKATGTHIALTLPAQVTPAAHRADAAMFGYGPQHTGVTDDTVLNSDNVHGLTRFWSYTAGDAITNSAATANGSIFVGCKDGILYAFDAKNGHKQWSFRTQAAIESAPAVANGIVYIGSDDYNLYALDATTGEQKWAFHTQGFVIAAPTVANGIVYVASGDQNLYALDAATGVVKWTTPTGSDIEAAPTVGNGIVYVGAFNGHVYAFHADSGKQLWAFQTTDHIFSAPALVNGIVYVGSNDIHLYALNATTGKQLWELQTGDSVFSSPAVANGIVYVGSMDHKLYAVDAASGAVKWSFTTGDKILSSPTVANGVVYIGSEDHRLYALNAADGKQLWSVTTGDKITASPIVANGIVYIGSEDHRFYAFHLPS
jgi:outer membrane protein assembly factor BamB/serine/threonine protein kinase